VNQKSARALEIPYPKKKDFDDFIPYWNTAVLLFAVGFLGRAIESFIGYRAIGFLFLFAVLVVGFLGRLGPVLCAAVLSWLSWNFFFIPPRFTFAISAPEDVLMCATYVFVAFATGILANRVKRQERILLERQARTNLLYEVMLDLSASERHNEFLLKINERLAEVLNGTCEVLLKAKDGSLSPLSLSASDSEDVDLARETEAAQAAFETGQLAGWSSEQFEDAKALYVPIKGHNETVGVFRYLPDQEILLSIDQENLLQSVCRQVGMKLEQRFVEERLREAERLRESDKMHQTLLNSISHELRTPLTAIIGSASALDDDVTLKNDSSRRRLAQEIKSSGERLNRVVENLLDMSRLNAGGIAIKKEWHDLSDLIGVAIQRVAHGVGARKIETSIESQLPLIEIDFRLMEHALSNILSNAITYSPDGSKIMINVKKNGERVEISTEDQGRGIEESYRAFVFDKFFRVPGSPPGGTGLGLSIVKSSVEFHGGAVTALGSSGGGARIVVSLPISHSTPSLQTPSTR
jgi:two-component system sensor histidine kinase KdpD